MWISFCIPQSGLSCQGQGCFELFGSCLQKNVICVQKRKSAIVHKFPSRNYFFFNSHLYMAGIWGQAMFCLHSSLHLLYTVLCTVFYFNVGKHGMACIYFVTLIFLRFCFHSISHSTHRTFGKQQWQQLHDSLSSWKANLAAVKSSLQALSPSA